MKLYTYWRSQAAFRVRIALRLKGIDAEMSCVDILKGEQFSESYRKLNPGMAVPTLVDGNGPPLVQSMAILEYLEERYRNPPLLPADVFARAQVRALAQVLVADAHPFVVPRVRTYLERELQADESARIKWMLHWLNFGLRTFEQQLTHAGRFCYGDSPTLADICLVPTIVTAKIFPGFSFELYPKAWQIFQNCMALEAFAAAEPGRQPDAPKTS